MAGVAGFGKALLGVLEESDRLLIFGLAAAIAGPIPADIPEIVLREGHCIGRLPW